MFNDSKQVGFALRNITIDVRALSQESTPASVHANGTIPSGDE